MSLLETKSLENGDDEKDHSHLDLEVPPPEPVATAEKEARPLHGFLWTLLTVAILSHTFLYALDNTIIATTRPPIIASLGEIERLPWISVGYALGEVGSNPLWGNVYRRFDDKIAFCLAIVIFDIGSALSGAAPNVNVLIAGRVIGGLGGSGIYIGTLNIFNDLTHLKERSLYLGIVGVAWCLGTLLGPIVGGGFADSSATWRWSFYINLCISAAAAPIILWYLPSGTSKRRALQQFREIDYLGGCLYVGAALTIIMAISFGGSIWPWSNGRIIALLALSCVLWACFACQQHFSFLTSKKNRIFPVEYCREMEMCNFFAQTAIGISCVVIPIYFLPLFWQFTRGESALDAGVHTLPFIASSVVGFVIQGVLLEKYSLYFLWFFTGGAVATIGLGLFTTLDPSLSDAKLYGYSVITGVGAAAYTQIGYAVGQTQHPSQPARVTAFLSLAQMGGLALSLGIGTSIFVNEASKDMAMILLDWDLERIHSLLAGSGSRDLADLDSSTQAQVFRAISDALRNVFIMGTVAAGLGTMLSLFMRKKPLFTNKDEGGANASQDGEK